MLKQKLIALIIHKILQGDKSKKTRVSHQQSLESSQTFKNGWSWSIHGSFTLNSQFLLSIPSPITNTVLALTSLIWWDQRKRQIQLHIWYVLISYSQQCAWESISWWELWWILVFSLNFILSVSVWSMVSSKTLYSVWKLISLKIQVKQSS